MFEWKIFPFICGVCIALLANLCSPDVELCHNLGETAVLCEYVTGEILSTKCLGSYYFCVKCFEVSKSPSSSFCSKT